MSPLPRSLNAQKSARAAVQALRAIARSGAVVAAALVFAIQFLTGPDAACVRHDHDRSVPAGMDAPAGHQHDMPSPMQDCDDEAVTATCAPCVAAQASIVSIADNSVPAHVGIAAASERAPSFAGNAPETPPPRS